MDFTATTTNCDRTTTYTITFDENSMNPRVVMSDPVSGHPREKGIRAALRYLSSKGKYWHGDLP